MSKKTKTELDQSLEQVLLGRVAELVRSNRLTLGRLEAQLESNAFHALKAAAKEASEVTTKFVQNEERFREKSSEAPQRERCEVQVRDGEIEVHSTGYTSNLYSGFSSAEWNLGGSQGQVRQGFAEEDGSGNRTVSGFRYQVAIHA